MKVLIFNMVDGTEFLTMPIDKTEEELRELVSDLTNSGSINVTAKLEFSGKPVARVVNPCNVNFIDIVEQDNADDC